jgi:hypothetical protein
MLLKVLKGLKGLKGQGPLLLEPYEQPERLPYLL